MRGLLMCCVLPGLKKIVFFSNYVKKSFLKYIISSTCQIMSTSVFSQRTVYKSILFLQLVCHSIGRYVSRFSCEILNPI